MIATIELTAASEGEKTHRSVYLLGRVYGYVITRFASAEGKNRGKFYTPSCVVRCLVVMLAPHRIVNSQIVLAAPSTESRQWRTSHRIDH